MICGPPVRANNGLKNEADRHETLIRSCKLILSERQTTHICLESSGRVGDSGMEARVGSWLTMDILVQCAVLV